MGLDNPSLHAVDIVAPVEVLVDVDERDRPPPLEGAEHRDRDGMVAAEHDRQRAGLEDLAHRLLGAATWLFRSWISARTSPQSTVRMLRPS